MSGRCGTAQGWRDHFDEGSPICPDCRRAHSAAKQEYRKRVYLARGPLLIDGTGTRRRLRALIRIGWPTARLGAELGTSPSAITKFMLPHPVRRDTAAKVAALYDRLWDKPGPSKVAARYAEKQGWAPPLAWDDDTIDDPRVQANWGRVASRMRKPIDEIAVQRAMRGDAVKLTAQERTEAVRRLRARGLSSAQIAALLHIERRSVERIKRKAS